MKKLIYFGAVALGLSTIFYACEKESVTNKTKSESDEGFTENSKSLENTLDDDFLMKAINGEVEEYEHLFKLETLLTNESPVSNKVLMHLSVSERIPDYLVELITILSPSAVSELDKIGGFRNNLNIDFIRENIRKTTDQKFIKINTVPRKIIFAEDFKIKDAKTSECNSCSKEVHSTGNPRLIGLSVEEDVIEQIGGPASDCSGYTYCGTPSNIFEREEARTSLHYSVYIIECTHIIPQECFSLNS